MGGCSDRTGPNGPSAVRVPEGARILVARTPDRAGELVVALRKAGAHPLLLPLIDFELARDQHSFDVAFDALGLFGYIQAVVFIGLLLAGLAYEWKKGALEWV